MTRRRAIFAAGCGLVLVCAPSRSSAAAASGRVVLLPPENLTASAAAPQQVADWLARALVERGWSVVGGETVDEMLRAAGERRLDSLPSALVPRLFERLDASAVALSSVETWLDGANAIVAISARLRGADGVELWSSLATRTAEQTESALGFGRAESVEQVADEALARLTKTLPGPGSGARRQAERRRPLGAAAPMTYRASAWAGREPRRVFLVPFHNTTDARLAPRLLGELLARRLTASGAFEVVEPADFRAALRAERLPSVRLLDADRLRAVGERLGSGLYLRGSIWKWREGSAQGASVRPELELELELVDGSTGEVLWAAHHARSGADYERLLMRGAIGSVVALADQVLAEMIGAALSAEPSAKLASLAREKRGR